ncbi:MAG: hypothetical protein AMXMBFR42_31830 [Burkholderiales bacterium]
MARIEAEVYRDDRVRRQRAETRMGTQATDAMTSGHQSDATFGDRLLRAAGRWPENTALVEVGRTVTYSALAEAACVVANRIVELPGARGGIVALLFESRGDALAAIAGVGLAGAAYVALDPGDPDARLRHILGDAAPLAIVAAEALVERAKSLAASGCPILTIDRDRPPAPANTFPRVDPTALATLIYTSASTGPPKGVMQTHRNLRFHSDVYARTLRIDESDRISLLYSMTFGAWIGDVLGALARGATLCAYDVRRQGARGLADWLDAQRITVLHAVPTVFREAMAGVAPERVFPHLRIVDLGGESALASDVELARRHSAPDSVFINQLGATEVVLIAQHPIARERDLADGPLPVGRCAQGVEVRIERDDGSEAACGETGEIVVLSAYASPGYWKRPDLDARAFEEVAARPGWRRYATGDLGRIDEHGDLCFLGRRGSRVKVRGFSVDLSEIERALSASPGVLRCAVVAKVGSFAPEVDRLVAHVVPAPDAVPDARSLRRRLSDTLPGYMLPSAYQFHAALPATASGKLDRRALEALPLPPPTAFEDDEPAGDLERAIAAIFAELLGRPRIGRHDDFFLAGGDSLRFAELAVRLRVGYGMLRTSDRDETTVAAIARRIGEHRATAGGTKSMPVLLPARATGKALPLFLVHGRLGQALVSPHFMQLIGDDQPLWSIQARGLDGRRAPHTSVEDMAEDYLREVSALRPPGTFALGALCAGAYVAVEMAHRMRAAGVAVPPLLLLDPPLGVESMDAAESTLLQRLRRRRAEGKITCDLDDPVYARAAVDVAQAFERAVRRHQPRRYDGPVFVLSSGSRLRRIGQEGLRLLYGGPLQCHEVAETHRQVLDVRNPAFAKGLRACLEAIRRSTAGSGPSGVPEAADPASGTA